MQLDQYHQKSDKRNEFGLSVDVEKDIGLFEKYISINWKVIGFQIVIINAKGAKKEIATMATIYDLDERNRTIAAQQNIIEQQQEIIDHQRNALQLLLNAIWIHVNSGGSDEQLQDAFRLVSSASTMTGTTEE